jgi:hypothetical protein
MEIIRCASVPLVRFCCSSVSLPPAAPAGTYDFTVQVAQDVSIPGTLEITRDGYDYHMEAAVEGETHVARGDSIEVTGNHVVLHLIAGEGEPVTFHLDFAGAGFTGAVATGEGSIPITGTRRTP